MGEVATPLAPLARWGAQAGLSNARAKLENLSPTGSFKDRGSTVLVTELASQGVETAVEDSSGNAGASIAAYCARAGIRAVVYAPASAPAAKLAQIEVYGAELHRVAGTREDVAAAAREAARAPGARYASHNLHPHFAEGTKTFAFELFEQLGGQMPDHIVFPVGNGSLFLGTLRGMDELAAIGCEIEPALLHLAQSAACSPIAEAAISGSAEPEPVQPRPTIAGGIAIAKPSRGRQILRALRRNGGAAAIVEEHDAWRERNELARLEGLFVEPTSAVAFAATRKLRQTGVIGEYDLVVIPVTGSGLKDPDARPPGG